MTSSTMGCWFMGDRVDAQGDSPPSLSSFSATPAESPKVAGASGSSFAAMRPSTVDLQA